MAVETAHPSACRDRDLGVRLMVARTGRWRRIGASLAVLAAVCAVSATTASGALSVQTGPPVIAFEYQGPPELEQVARNVASQAVLPTSITAQTCAD
jgi:hypothetical protein